MTNPQLAEMHKRAERLSQQRDELARHFQQLQADLDAAKQRHMATIKAIARRVAKEHAELVALIEANPDLFVKPRTQVVEGIKFGFQAGRGSLVWEDDAKVCSRIFALAEAGDITGEEADLFVSVTTKPSAEALRRVDPKLLKRMGITIEGDGDKVLVKNVDSSIEKAVNAVITAAIKDAQAGAED